MESDQAKAGSWRSAKQSRVDILRRSNRQLRNFRMGEMQASRWKLPESRCNRCSGHMYPLNEATEMDLLVVSGTR